MGWGDNRKSPKMRQRKGRARKKARVKRQREEALKAHSKK